MTLLKKSPSGEPVEISGASNTDQVLNLSTIPGATASDALEALGPAVAAGAALTDADETLLPTTVSQYTAADGLLTVPRAKTLDAASMGSGQSVVINGGAQTTTMGVLNNGPNPGTVFTFPGDGVRRSASFFEDTLGNVQLGSWWFTS